MRILYFSICIVFIDQIAKFFVKGLSIPALGISIKGMSYGSSINIISNFFQLTYIENPGMAFGIEFGGKLTLSIFTIFATIMIIFLIYRNRKESFYMRLSLAFILGGAIGNLIDRIFYGIIYGYAPLFYGKVVDFFHIIVPDFKIFGKTFYSWPIFNMADISVTIGFIMILSGYRMIFHKKKEELETNSMVLDNIIPEEFPRNENQSQNNISSDTTPADTTQQGH